MPIYEYQCGSCGNRFEELMRRSDPDPGCPSCDSDDVSRLISNTSFRLKGTGWYSTDYVSTKSKPRNTKPDDASPASSDAGSSSGDAAELASSSKKEPGTSKDGVAAA